MRTLCIALAALALASCTAVKPQQGGGQQLHFGGADAPTTVSTVAPENPQTPSTTTVEKTTVRDYAPPSPFLQGSSAVERQTHNLEAAGLIPVPAPNLDVGRGRRTPPHATARAPEPATPAPQLLRESVHEKATTTLGTAQKDTARELAARLSNMRGVMWVGVLLLLGGPLVGWKMGWFTNGCIAGATGLGLIILAQILPGNEAWFGLLGLGLIPVIAFVYYRSRHDAAEDGQT